jgi:hypothetical protein
MKKLSLIFAVIAFYPCFGQQDTIFNYLMTFESEPTMFFQQASPTTDIWQMGIPEKDHFNAAWQGEKVIVTDRTNPYPANNHSWFDLEINCWELGYPFVGIEFMQKIETDTLKDGGYISVSYDDGHSWCNIIKDSIGKWSTPYQNWFDIFQQNLYADSNILVNGEFGFSGSIPSWQKVNFAWFDLVTKKKNNSDKMIIRFNFISDSIDNHHDGWMIDNLRVYTLNLGGSISELDVANSLSLYPIPLNEQSKLVSKSGEIIKQIMIYNLMGQKIGQYQAGSSTFDIGSINLKSGTYIIETTLQNNKTGYLKAVK